jgi:hypothetical protein
MSTDSLFWPVETQAAAPRLRDEAFRKDWTRKLNEVARVVESADPVTLGPLVVDMRREFTDAAQAGKSELLGNPLCWDTEERNIAQWLGEGYSILSRSATRVCERLASGPTGDDADQRLAELMVVALVSRGNSQKWHAIAGSSLATSSLSRIHGLFRLAERRGVARAPVSANHEGVRHTVTVEGMYLRVLLFGFLFNGHLARQQVEILDSWLWTWVSEYRLTAEPEQGALGLWVDLQAEEGVRNAFVAPQGLDVRFLVVSTLVSQIDEVVGGFHAGTIFPGYGVSCDFRIEEHVAVVDFLQGLLQRLKRAGGAPRSARRTLAMPRIEAFVGVGEILRRGLGEGYSDSEQPRRFVRIRDVSDTGMRLVAQERDWQSIEVGDLLGFREPSTGTFVVCEVVRKLPDSEPQCVQLGVSVVSREPRRVTFKPHGGAGATLDALYLPGEDNCGRADMLLGTDNDIAGFGVRDLEVGAFIHAVQPNRVRRRGRGWTAAGFEVLEVSPIPK